MIVLVIILSWFLIGGIIGRILFASALGDAPRRENRARHSYDKPEWLVTRNYQLAFRIGMWSIPFWPATLAMAGITLPTPAERREANEIKAKKFSKRMELLDQQYQQFVKDTSK